MQINPKRLKSSIQPRPLKSNLPKQTEIQLDPQITTKSIQTRPDPLTQSVSIIESLQTITDHTK